MLTREPRCLPLLEQLIAFDSTSRNSNLDLIHHVRDHLAGHGITSEMVYDEDRSKANLYATLGPDDRAGIALSGHTDVVPVDGQAWNSDPFRLERRDDRLYGRGTADMKGFLAACLEAVPRILRADLRDPVHFAFSYDEEVGCLGVRRLLDRLRTAAVRPRLCLIGEPTGLTVVRAHKGRVAMRCRVQGRASHSGLAHLGANAVEAAAELIAYLKSRARRFRDEGPHDAEFSPPYTTVHTGMIHGGTALNIVPSECWFDFEFRHLPVDDPGRIEADLRAFAQQQLLPELRAVAPEAGFEFEMLSAYPGLNAAEDDEVVRLALALSGSNSTGKVSFGTEGGLFQREGIPAVICGPGHIEQAHKPDEYVEISQLLRCEEMIDRLVDSLSGRP